jgi:lipopolysaccharide/colanic/teichoic acid biosynthesis glycosyltransferase
MGLCLGQEQYLVARSASLMAKYMTAAEGRMKTNGSLKEHSLLQSTSLYAASPWCNSSWKRGCDILAAILLLIVCLPVMILLALGVKLSSRGPVFFRQRRPGKNRHEFSILKFRTMRDSRHDRGSAITRPCDPRVTLFGRFMRKWKLDELPQLFNVLRGEMSLVGPRPLPTSHWRQPLVQEEAACVLSVRPGITSQATLRFRNEEELLAPFSVEEVEEVYMRAFMPVKVRIELEYLQGASFTSDLSIVFKTAFRIFDRQEKGADFVIREYVLDRLQRCQTFGQTDDA